MNDTFKMGQGLGHQLEMGFARNDWTEADVQKLKEGNLLAQVLHLVRGTGIIQIIKPTINLAGDCIPKDWKCIGWTIEKHVGDGAFELDPSRFQLVFSPNQIDGKIIEGHKLREELENNKAPVLNACVLDYLLLHPELIPENWKKNEKGSSNTIFFWGTIYRIAGTRLCVRYLYWNGVSWDWNFRHLDDGWRDQDLSMILR